MKEFHVEITEILQKTVKIKAENQEEAVEAAKARYSGGEYVATEFDVRP